MRIISGIARGTKLYTLDGMETTRPTLDRVKESVFNIIQNDLQDKIFLDLFAGSGAIGLEAASRGTKKVILCDKSSKACEVIRKNIQKTHMENKVELYNLDYIKVINEKIKDIIDVVYIDPPYETNLIYDSLKLILEKKIINEQTTIILETDDEKRILKELEKLPIEIKDNRKYGRANILFAKYNIDLRKG